MFITFEGIEGVGKTTHLKNMAAQLTAADIPVIATREPGGTPMGEEMRDILLAHRDETVSSLTELLLMFAARAQHVETVIKPALAKGCFVLCDRFIDATYAYQGGGRGVSMDLIQQLETLVLQGFKPDLTLLFEAPVEIGLSRVKARGNPHDRFEKENLDFFRRIAAVYHERALLDKTRYKVIDASKPLALIEKEMIDLTQKLIKNHAKNAAH